MTRVDFFRNLSAAACLIAVAQLDCWVIQLPLPIYRLLPAERSTCASISYFDRLLATGINDYKTYLRRGLAYAMFGCPQLALCDFNYVLKKRHKCSKALRYRAYVETCIGGRVELQNALRDYTRLIERTPVRASDLAARAFVYNQLGNGQLSLKDADRAVKLDPTFARAYLMRAYAQLKLSKYADVFSDCRIVTQLTADDSPLRFQVSKCCAEAYISQNQFRRALTLCNSALQQYPMNSNMLCLRALSCYRLGDLKQAVADTTASTGVNPTCAAAYLIRAAAYSKLHDKNQSWWDLREAHKLDPNLFSLTELTQ